MRTLVAIFSVPLLLTPCSAQDLHWSQPATALLYVNPAFTGASGKFSVNAGHRSQWNAIHSIFRTVYAGADLRLGPEKNDQLFNLGAIFYNDLQGQGSLKSNCFGLTASSLIEVANASFFGVGFSYQRTNLTLIADRFSWGAQYSGFKYDPALPSGEPSGTTFLNYGNLQAGISYLFREGDENDYTAKRTFLAGYSADHLTKPAIHIAGGGERLSLKHTAYAQAYLPADAVVALKPFIIVQVQGPKRACTLGALYRTAFGEVSRYTGNKRGSGFSVGLSYRVLDALIPTFEYERDNFIIGFSYDINVSRLTAANRFTGSTEISLRITPKRQPTIPAVPARPSTRSM